MNDAWPPITRIIGADGSGDALPPVRMIRSQSFEIRSDVPIPLRGNTKYPTDRLEKGQSFFVPLQSGQDIRYLRATLCATASRFGKRQKPKRKFTARSTSENGVLGVGVWRIA